MAESIREELNKVVKEVEDQDNKLYLDHLEIIQAALALGKEA